MFILSIAQHLSFTLPPWSCLHEADVSLVQRPTAKRLVALPPNPPYLPGGPLATAYDLANPDKPKPIDSPGLDIHGGPTFIMSLTT